MSKTKPRSAETRKPKPADAPNGKTFIVLGLDGDKPHAARFIGANPALVTKAAEALKLKVVEVAGQDHAELVAKLPLGRLYSNGRGFVPPVREELYLKLTSALRVSLKGEKRERAPLPRSWDEIAVGSLVIAPEAAEEWGFYHAIVLERKGDMLTFRWRDYPEQGVQTRHVATVALLNADTAE
jgi:hypothetical protein